MPSFLCFRCLFSRVLFLSSVPRTAAVALSLSRVNNVVCSEEELHFFFLLLISVSSVSADAVHLKITTTINVHYT